MLGWFSPRLTAVVLDQDGRIGAHCERIGETAAPRDHEANTCVDLELVLELKFTFCVCFQVQKPTRKKITISQTCFCFEASMAFPVCQRDEVRGRKNRVESQRKYKTMPFETSCVFVL